VHTNAKPLLQENDDAQKDAQEDDIPIHPPVVIEVGKQFIIPPGAQVLYDGRKNSKE